MVGYAWINAVHSISGVATLILLRHKRSGGRYCALAPLAGERAIRQFNKKEWVRGDDLPPHPAEFVEIHAPLLSPQAGRAHNNRRRTLRLAFCHAVRRTHPTRSRA